MNRTLLLVITCLIITTSVSAWNWFGLKPDPKERAFDKLLGRLERELSTEFGLKGCAAGGSTIDGIANMTLFFNYRGPLELEELERMVILCTERMVQRMNEDEKARPYLANYPVTVKNITLGIFNHDVNGREAYPPYPGFVSVCVEKLKISYRDKDNEYQPLEVSFVPYAEAKARILG